MWRTREWTADGQLGRHRPRFEQEARAAGALSHPNVCAVYDVGSHEGAPYAVEELLEGESLQLAWFSPILRGLRMPEIDKSIARVLEAYTAAVYAKDVGAMMQLYDPKVRIFDAWGTWSYEGAAAWQVAVEAWFTSLGTERVDVTFDEVQTSGSPDFAVVSAIVTYAGQSASGEQLRAMHNRISWALKTSGHVLRVIHEHTSAPIGFEDMKAILQRAKGA